jgi:hypothetical protein
MGEGLSLPELAPSVEAAQPYHGALTPADLQEFVQLPGRLVLNTSCSLGTPEFAGAFLRSGCHSYIGATGDPDGEAALFYVLHFFYELHYHGRSVAEAHERAASHDIETGLFTLFPRPELVSSADSSAPAG